jgi:UDP-glucose 4-epimerase
MRVVVFGATGNVGTSLLGRMASDDSVDSIVGVARRPGRVVAPKVSWRSADVGRDDLTALVEGADAVVHLAWVIQPSHRESEMARTNVLGSRRVFEAAAAANVGTLVYASSVGAYAPGPKDRRVDEAWPATGIAGSFYARHKARVEALLDDIETRTPTMRVVRMRPGLIFKRSQASEAHRLFLVPLVPSALVSPRVLKVLPDVPGLRFQAVHTDDVADAYHRAVTGDVAGAFNLVAEPALDLRTIASALGARTIRVPASAVRAFVDVTWRARLQPTPVGWLEMGLAVPLLSSERAHAELGWRPSTSSIDAVLELLDGLGNRAGEATPPLQTRAPAIRS